MPAVAKALLIALGTAHAARRAAYLAEHTATDATADASIARGNATSPGRGVFRGLPENQYVLEWEESASTWFMYLAVREAQTPKYYFIAPVMCRNTGFWYKLKIANKKTTRHCLRVTCTLEGDVEKVEPEQYCADFTDRVLRVYSPYVTRNSDWALFHAPNQDEVLSTVETTSVVHGGWSFKTLEVKKKLEKKGPFNFYEDALFMDKRSGWDLSPKCEKYKAAWEQVGLVYTNKASLESCRAKRSPLRESCVGKYQPLIGTATAWEVKNLFKKEDALEKALPSCATWCKKALCVKTATPEGPKRDTAAIMQAMNSWKYTCEQELDAHLTRKVKACNTIGSVCDLDWEKFEPCAQRHSLPYYY